LLNLTEQDINTIVLDNLPSGFYVLKINSEKGLTSKNVNIKRLVMKLKSVIILSIIYISAALTTSIEAQVIDETSDSIPSKDFRFVAGKPKINTALWTQPYRFQNDKLKTLSVQIIIEPTNDQSESLDFDQFMLLDETNKFRIRPVAVFYYKGEKKMYLKSKSVNQNYNSFMESNVVGYKNFEAETYRTNFLGIKKKKIKPSVKSLKKTTIKGKKATYYLDFPIQDTFTYGKIYYKNSTVGFAAIKGK